MAKSVSRELKPSVAFCVEPNRVYMQKDNKEQFAEPVLTSFQLTMFPSFSTVRERFGSVELVKEIFDGGFHCETQLPALRVRGIEQVLLLKSPGSTGKEEPGRGEYTR